MSHYIDVYVLPLPKANTEAYRKMAELAGKVWRDHGALEYFEVIADDVKPGKNTSFPQAVKLEPEETVIVGIVTFESREHRDRINEAVKPDSMPFDGKRMFWGGFAPLFET